MIVYFIKTSDKITKKYQTFTLAVNKTAILILKKFRY
jgi:hypothetical protein